MEGKRLLIAGYGREGRSSAAWLGRLGADCRVDIAHDDAEAAIALRAARDEGQPYDMVVKSPGIPTMKFDGL